MAWTSLSLWLALPGLWQYVRKGLAACKLKERKAHESERCWLQASKAEAIANSKLQVSELTNSQVQTYNFVLWMLNSGLNLSSPYNFFSCDTAMHSLLIEVTTNLATTELHWNCLNKNWSSIGCAEFMLFCQPADKSWDERYLTDRFSTHKKGSLCTSNEVCNKWLNVIQYLTQRQFVLFLDRFSCKFQHPEKGTYVHLHALP